MLNERIWCSTVIRIFYTPRLTFSGITSLRKFKLSLDLYKIIEKKIPENYELEWFQVELIMGKIQKYIDDVFV